MKHKHHIIPKHMGGTDDSSNLIELTIEEHAEAHRILFEQHGKKEDWLAWQGLSGLISKKDILKELYTSDVWNDPLFRKKHKQATKDAVNKPEVLAKIRGYVRTESHSKNANARFTEEYLKRVGNSIARKWKVITPNNEEIFIHNMTQFCKQNKLSPGGMSSAAKLGISHKGYRCEKLGK